MTNIYFKYGKFYSFDGPGLVRELDAILNIARDDFMLFGEIGTEVIITADKATIDGKNAKSIDYGFDIDLYSSKAENVNLRFISLWDDSSVSDSIIDMMRVYKGDNVVDGEVSARVVKFYKNANLNINGILKVPNKDDLDFSKISGNGKIYGQKQHAYYDTKNTLLEYDTNIDLSTLNAGDGNEAFSFDGSKLILNEGYEFILNGDKPVFITNNATILKADINGTKLKSITGDGSIKELHLSGGAEFSLNGDFGNAVIEKGSVLTLFKQIDFSSVKGDGLVNINGMVYDTDGNILNIDFDDTAFLVSLFASFDNAAKYNFKVTKAIEKMKIHIDEEQIDLLNIEMANNDNLI